MSREKSFEFESAIGYLMFKAHRVIANRLFKNLREQGFDITPEQWMLLVHLWQNDGMNQNQLARECGRDKTTITRAIQNMEKLNLVKRKKDKDDGRVKHVFLTEKAEKLHDKVVGTIEQTIEEAQQGIGLYDLEITKDTLKKIYKNLSPYVEDEE